MELERRKMKVNGKEVIMLPLEILNVNVYCPHDFLSGSVIKEVERYFGGVSSVKCESNLDCEDCWRECANRINTIYGTTPTFIEKKRKKQ